MSSMPPPPPPPSGISEYPTNAYVSDNDRASFGVRLGAYLIDSVLYGLLLAPFAIAATVLGVAAFKDCDRTTVDGTTEISCTGDQLKGGLLFAAVVIGLIGFLVVAFVYLRQLGKTGQTWGRSMLNIKVVDKNTGQPIGFGRALGRTLLERTISQWLCFLGFLWMLWDADKQTWHDKIVNSVVVRTS